MQFLYPDGDVYHFMDTESYEQTHLTAETLGDAVHYLLADSVITISCLRTSRWASSYR